jgi:hypothetical protein
MHFLDMDTLTHAHLGHRKVASRIERAGEQNVATTIVTAIEHRACVNDRPPCLHHVCTYLVPRDLVARRHLLTLVVREKIMEVARAESSLRRSSVHRSSASQPPTWLSVDHCVSCPRTTEDSPTRGGGASVRSMERSRDVFATELHDTWLDHFAFNNELGDCNR